jgi:hypothetical protein
LVTLEEFVEALAALREIPAELQRLNEKVDALLNGNGGAEWLDAEGSAAYLSRTKGAIERAWSRKTIPSVLTPDGKRRSSKAMLDEYMLQGNGARR